MAWHGYTDEQVQAIWHLYGWQNRTVIVLKSIAECEDATTETRLSALKILNYFTIGKVLPVDPCMPGYMCRTMLAIAECRKEKRKERVQKLMDERLQACNAILETMCQFVQKPEDEGTTSAQSN